MQKVIQGDGSNPFNCYYFYKDRTYTDRDFFDMDKFKEIFDKKNPSIMRKVYAVSAFAFGIVAVGVSRTKTAKSMWSRVKQFKQ